MKFDIFEGNIEQLRGKMKKMEKKCVKYGNPFHYKEEGEKFKTIEVTGTNDQKGKQVLRYIVVDVSGSPIINNWKFIASCTHTAYGNIFGKACWDVEIPKRYYHSDCVCEHCNSRRIRKETYIIKNEETGEFKQVGKSCLKDYTNGMSSEMVAAYISLYDEVISYEAPPIGYEHKKRYAELREALLYIAETIRHYEIKKTWGIDYLSINSNYKVVSRALKRAEEAAHGEAGRLIKIKQTTFAELWVPESEAKTLKEAYETALQAVENGWKVDNDPIVEVKCAEDNEYRDEYILEKL